ncbi:hypothetical protein AB0D54_24160 [Streptomyces xanthophaeus]|uniref:hypothetical protein n=1 Tax=Streptomyces xanthophaeus TaxID=67385 RepID=UPI0034134094
MLSGLGQDGLGRFPPVIEEALAVLDGSVGVVVGDMHSLRSLVVTGLHALHDDLALRLRAHGVAFFACGWQAQPQRFLVIVDSLYPTRRTGREPTALLRRTLRDAAASQRAAGAEAARAAAGIYGTPKPDERRPAAWVVVVTARSWERCARWVRRWRKPVSA